MKFRNLSHFVIVIKNKFIVHVPRSDEYCSSKINGMSVGYDIAFFHDYDYNHDIVHIWTCSCYTKNRKWKFVLEDEYGNFVQCKLTYTYYYKHHKVNIDLEFNDDGLLTSVIRTCYVGNNLIHKFFIYYGPDSKGKSQVRLEIRKCKRNEYSMGTKYAVKHYKSCCYRMNGNVLELAGVIFNRSKK